MKSYPSPQKSRSLFTVLLVLSTIFAVPLLAGPQGRQTRTLHVKGVAVTGPNDLCGEPIWFMPAPIPPTLHGTSVGQFNPSPGAVNALPLSPANCGGDILLATHTDPVFLAAIGFPDSDPRIRNIPLRQVPVIVTPDGLRLSIPPIGALPPNAFPPTKSNPNDPITLGAWLRARGELTILCRPDGSASVESQFDHLIPHGIYSMWAVWKTTPPGAPGPGLIPLPLGGVPNVFSADKQGRGSFERELAACPLDPTPDGSQFLFVSLAYHSDGSLYGAVPELPAGSVGFLTPGGVFMSNLPAGLVNHDQVEFAVTVSPISSAPRHADRDDH